MKKVFVSGLMIGLVFGAQAESVTNNLNLNKGIVYNHGAVKPADSGLTFTNAGIRDVTISAGQLSGVDPEDGTIITNAANLLPLKAQSLTADGNVVAGGTFIGDGSGLTNLNVNALSGPISVSSLPASGTWDASGLTINNANLAGTINVSGDSLTISTNLTVQGTLSGDASGLTGLPAGGNSGELQFNDNGILSGNTNCFIHPETGKVAFNVPTDSTFMRAYRDKNDLSTNSIVYMVRRFDDTAELCLLNEGIETLRLRGDGSIYAAGSLDVGGLSVAGSTSWFIPEEGDLSMGSFTQE